MFAELILLFSFNCAPQTSVNKWQGPMLSQLVLNNENDLSLATALASATA